MTEVTRRNRPLFPLLPDLGELFDPIPALLTWGTPPTTQTIRIEAHFEPDAFIVRAELPGIDPAQDVEVTVSQDVLTLHAQRSEEKKDRHHSEFRYGSFTRSLRLPADAKTEQISASYDAGILTVHVPLDKPVKAAARTIEVKAQKPATHKSAK